MILLTPAQAIAPEQEAFRRERLRVGRNTIQSLTKTIHESIMLEMVGMVNEETGLQFSLSEFELLLSLYPEERNTIFREWDCAQGNDAALDVVSHFLLGCNWPDTCGGRAEMERAGVEDFDHNAFLFTLRDQAVQFGIGQPK